MVLRRRIRYTAADLTSPLVSARPHVEVVADGCKSHFATVDAGLAANYATFHGEDRLYHGC